MRLQVALTPGWAADVRQQICIVVDVLRASSTLITMFQRGIREVIVAPTVDKARRLATELGQDYILCGEVGGLPPPGFHFGNSPKQFSQMDLSRRRAIFATTNGTRAMSQVADAALVLVGAILNATSVAKAALSAAHIGHGITIVCAGQSGGAAFALEDAVGAGAIAQAIVENGSVEMDDGATATLALYRIYADDLASALQTSEHGHGLARLALAEDLVFCAQKDLYRQVPRLGRDAAGRFVLRALS